MSLDSLHLLGVKHIDPGGPMEIHIRTLVFVLLSLLGSASLPFLVQSVPEGATANALAQALPTPTPVPLRGLSAQSQGLVQQLQRTAPIPTVEAPVVTAAFETTAVVRTDGANLNIRSGPGLDHALLGSAPPGRMLDVTGLSPDREWLRVQLPQGSGQGWVYAALTDLDGDAASLPIVLAKSSSIVVVSTPTARLPIICTA
jgi:uncharacterized protein YraI